jgi:hypothetical protein
MIKKKKKPALTPPPFVPPDGAEAVMDGQFLVGYVVWEGGDQWRAFTANGRALGLFADHREAVKACPSRPHTSDHL